MHNIIERHKVGFWLGFITIYTLLAMFSLETRDPWSLSSAVWLPAGLVLGTLCICPRLYWPLWGVSAGLLHIFLSLLYGRTLDVALTFAVVDLAILFPLAMMWHSVQRYLNHFSWHREMLLLLTGIYVASVLGGVLSALILMLLDYPVILSHFYTWSLSNATGCLSIASFFIIYRYIPEERVKLTLAQIFSLILVVGIFLLPPALLQNPLINHALLYLVLGITLVLSARWSLRLVSGFFLFLTVLVSLCTLSELGPLAVLSQLGLQTSQLFLLATISLGYIVATHCKEISVHGEKMHQQLLLLETLLKSQQPVFFQLQADAKELTWLQAEPVFGISPKDVMTLQLLQARLHPEDRGRFTDCLSMATNKISEAGENTFRMLLADYHYHDVRCNFVHNHPQFGTLGVLILYT